jgi:hypothetical protein
MSRPDLGRLEKVDIRSLWKNEASEFTPWLAEPENMQLLGDTIGLELQVESVEKEVGPFYADILCKETTSDRYVVIENQIERTDHDHLGKTITYAAGLGATAVVWIAKHFRDEHRAAFDWLNEITGADVGFYGLEIEAWCIGESQRAPKFNVVCRPNEFVAVEKGESGLTATRQAQLDFWIEFKDYLEESIGLKCSKPSPNAWMNHPIGRSGLWLSSIVSTWDSAANSYANGELRVDLNIDDGHAGETLAALALRKAEIENELADLIPEVPVWYEKEGVRSRRVYVRLPADILDRDQWPNYREWLRSRLEAFDRVFRPRVEMLGAGA